MTRYRPFLLRANLFALALIAGARPAPLGAQNQAAHRWQQVYADAQYQVSLDTANIESQPANAYLVWYQTIHTTLRDHEGKPWNREIIRSVLRCDPVSFKTVRITVFYDDGPAVAQEGGGLEDVVDDPWREATASVDRAAMTRACEIIRARIERGQL